MTQSTSLADIASEIECLSTDLYKVTATIELVGKPAQLKANEIAAALDDAKDRFSTALADQAEIERAQRLTGFTDIEVICPDDGRNLISAPFTIRYTKSVYDMATKSAVPIVHDVNGFASLPDDAFEYLIARKPEAIPAAILALSPGDANAAFDIYFAGKRRGYITLPAIAA